MAPSAPLPPRAVETATCDCLVLVRQVGSVDHGWLELYVLDHAEIKGMRLIHGVVSHPPLFVPIDHAWVELPGDIVFDGVLQTFFTRASYYAIMAAMPVDGYSVADTRRLTASQGHLGPWNAKWVPTPAQLDAYAAGVRARLGRSGC